MELRRQDRGHHRRGERHRTRDRQEVRRVRAPSSCWATSKTARSQSAVEDLRANGRTRRRRARPTSRSKTMSIALRDAALAEFGAAPTWSSTTRAWPPAPRSARPPKIWKWVIDVDLYGVIYGDQRLRAALPRTERGPRRQHRLPRRAGRRAGNGPVLRRQVRGRRPLGVALSRAAPDRGSNVGVSVLCPGFVRTRIHESERNMPNELASYAESPDGPVDRRRRRARR